MTGHSPSFTMQAMFNQLSERLQGVLGRFSAPGRLKEEDVNRALRDVRLALLEADVALPVVKEFVTRVRERATGAEIHRALNSGQQALKIVHEELIATLGEPGRLDFSHGQPPHVLLLIGLNGAGKTTTAAKLAIHLRREGKTPFLVAADTQRPAAIEQLQILGRQIDVPVYAEAPGIPAPEVARRGIAAAAAERAAVCIVDTAGRTQIDAALMDELAEVARLTQPVETLLVADAMTGQEAVNIARGFHERVPLTGLILTKVDGDARGGAAISMRAVSGVPIQFLGTGEKLDGLELFHPERLSSRILGMGDVLTLIEKAQDQFDEREAEKLQEKLLRNRFSLQDFLEQLQRIRRMGSLNSLLGMMPGLGRLADQIDSEELDGRIRQVEAIIHSMTPAERDNPRILNASRRRRIARGSGTQVRDINQLLRQFRQMQKMMGQFGGALGGGKASRRLPRGALRQLQALQGASLPNQR